jgi:hypothetical protein
VTQKFQFYTTVNWSGSQISYLHITIWSGAGFHIIINLLPFPAAAEENLGFIVGIFHFLTEKVNFILPFGLGPDFILPFGLGPDFILPSQDFLGQVNTGSFARPLTSAQYVIHARVQEARGPNNYKKYLNCSINKLT